jgi:hypothetical protein
MHFPSRFVVVVFLLFILLSETDRDFTASGLFLLLSDGSQSSVNLSYVRIFPSHLYISFLLFILSGFLLFHFFSLSPLAYPHGRLLSYFYFLGCLFYLFIYFFPFFLKKINNNNIYFCVCGGYIYSLFGYGLQVASAGHVPSIRYRLATVSWHLLQSLSLSCSLIQFCSHFHSRFPH